MFKEEKNPHDAVRSAFQSSPATIISTRLRNALSFLIDLLSTDNCA